MLHNHNETTPADSEHSAARISSSTVPGFSADSAAPPDRLPLNGVTEEQQDLAPAITQQIRRGIQQRLQAVSVCLNLLVGGKTLPEHLEPLVLGAVGQELSRRLTALGPNTLRRIPWTWLCSSDLLLSPRGQITVYDHCLSLPQGLEQLRVSAAWVRSHLFPDWSVSSGSCRRTVLLHSGYNGSTWAASEFLANSLGIPLVQGRDMVSDRGTLRHLFSPKGHHERPSSVETLVRRIDDELLDPNCFRPDSLVGIPGLIRCWKAGQVQLLSPPGTGLAGLRSFGRMIPAMITSLLGETPLLPAVQSLDLTDPPQLASLLKNPQQWLIRTNNPEHPARPMTASSTNRGDWDTRIAAIRRNPEQWTARPVSAEAATGLRIRVFSSGGAALRLLPAALATPPGPDGGVPLAAGSPRCIRLREAIPV